MRSMTSGCCVNWRITSWKQVPRGFTLIDVLLVFCVILAIVAIILPFIQLAREESRRNQCMYNLREIGSAVLNYHDSHNCFPAGFDVHPEGRYLGWGWNLKVLPYTRSADLYQRIEPYFAEGMRGLPNLAEGGQKLQLFRCPTDNGMERLPRGKIVSAEVVGGIVTSGTEDWQTGLPRSTYFGNAEYLQLEVGGIQYNAAGTPTSVLPLVNKGSLGNFGTKRSPEHYYCDQNNFGGIFGQNSHVKLDQISDGTSNTLMIGERYSPADSGPGAVGHGTWIGVPDCTRAQGLAMALGDAGVRINIGMPLREQTTGFGSLHHGGASFCFADGSVRFVSQQLDPALYRCLSVIYDADRP